MIVPPLSRQQLRELDRRAIDEFSIPGIVLMENAGAAAARWLAELGIAGPVVIACGKGNNGGDGYVMARHLDAAGYTVCVVLVCAASDLSGDALTQYRIIQRSGIECLPWSPLRADPAIDRLLRAADWLVDALVGTGLGGPVREPIASAIARMNSTPAKKLAIDIPSGLDCDHGQPLGDAIRANATATFAATKIGFAQIGAEQFTGVVRVLDIGLPRCLLQEYGAT